MNDEFADLIISIKTSLASIEEKINSIRDTLSYHEDRIKSLEKKTFSDQGSFKNDVIQMLLKAVLISICSFATLAGAGGVIAKILGY